MKILKVVVGSKLHRLDTPDSDTDTKAVHVSSLREIISPFNETSKAHVSGDNVSYELCHFADLAVKGNPTVLEVMYSDLVWLKTSVGDELINHREKFLDERKIKAAHLGFAQSQKTKRERHGLSDKRTRKHLVAQLRVLLQGYALLKYKSFNPDTSACPEHKLMLEAKQGNPDALAEIEKVAEQYEKLLLELPALKTATADYHWIEMFLTSVYREA